MRNTQVRFLPESKEQERTSSLLTARPGPCRREGSLVGAGREAAGVPLPAALWVGCGGRVPPLSPEQHGWRGVRQSLGIFYY